VTILALSTDDTLLLLKLVFLVLLYAFILLIVRTATKDLGGAPQESIVLGAAEASALRAQVAPAPRQPAARLRVLEGPGVEPGAILEVTDATVLGRAPDTALSLDGDDFASAHHARVEAQPDGIWVEDLGSTNGTFVNGARVSERRLLQPGDVIRIGQTELRLER
jgi:predicted component of type VI protein secretion system